MIDNTNWNIEYELPSIEDIKQSDEWYVSFAYNGYNLVAVINYNIIVNETIEEDINFHEIDVLDVDLSINKLYMNDEDFILPLKELIKLQYELASDLKIQY